MSRACGILVHYCGFVKKNHIKKNCYHPQYFKGKNYKAIFSTSSILKKKSTKTIIKKKTKKCKKEDDNFGRKKSKK